MRLFDRTVKVTIAGLPVDRFAAGPPTNAVEITAMRIRFDVNKNLGKHPNKCVVKLTNLAPATRNQFNKLPLRLILQAGYDGVLKLLFDGDVQRAPTEKEGTSDVVTEVHVGDASRSYSSALLVKSYVKPVSVRTVVKDCADRMGLPIPPEIAKSPALSQPLPDGFSSSSDAAIALTTLLSPLGMSWSSQNRQLIVLSDSQVREGQEFLIDGDRGMIGSPKLKESHKSGAASKTEVTVQTLLYPELLPGSGARVSSEFLNMRVKLTDVTHKGDSQSGGQDFTTSITGTPVGAS